MNRLRPLANLSLASLHASPSMSHRSTAISESDMFSFEDGIGTLSGRAIYAVGEFALRGVDRIAIRRQLKLIESAFPHNDGDEIKNVEQRYDIIFELSRSQFYPEAIRERALRVLILQIAKGQTLHLCHTLVKWPTVEIALFLSEIMGCMPQDWLPPGINPSKMQQRLMLIYLSSTDSLQNAASNLLKLFLDLSETSNFTHEAILIAGYLDMLLNMWSCDFSGSINYSGFLGVLTSQGRSAILDSCTTTLKTLYDQPDSSGHLITSHPIWILWGTDISPEFPVQVQLRGATWRSLNQALVAKRLFSLRSRLWRGDTDFHPLTHVAADLMEFCREDHYGDFVAQESLGLLQEFSRVFPHAEKWNASVREARHASGYDTELPHLFDAHTLFDSSEVFSTPTTSDLLLTAGDVVGKGYLLRDEKISLIPAPPGINRRLPALQFEVIRPLVGYGSSATYLVKEVFTTRPHDNNPTQSSDPENSTAAPRAYGRKYALKLISKSSMSEEARTRHLSAASNHQSLQRHPHTSSLYHVFETPSFLLLLQEYLTGEDLSYFLAQSHDNYDPPSPTSDTPPPSPSSTSFLTTQCPDQLLSVDRIQGIASMFSQMCEAVGTIHEQGVFLRDISLESFGVKDEWIQRLHGRREHKTVVKLANFESCTKDVDSYCRMEYPRTPYMSFERTNGHSSTYKTRSADIWALGVILLQMLYRCDPWKDTTDGACQAFILYQRYPVLFFLDRFQGMTLPVAKFLANRVFCILDDPDDDSKRIDARSLGRWVGGLPYLLTRSRSGSKVDREGEVLLRNIALASQVLAREIRRASKYHTRRGVKILDFSLAS